MNLFGIEFAPLNIPLERRLQTLSAATTFFLFVVTPFLSVFASFYILFFTKYWWALLLYFVYIYFDQNTSKQGGKQWNWLRSFFWFKYYYNYHNMRVHKTFDKSLDPNRNYLFCAFPHGIIPTVFVASFLTNFSDLPQMFPQHPIRRLVTLNFQFWIPFSRELSMAAGAIRCDYNSIKYVLNKKGGGQLLGIAPGGAEEALYSQPNQYRIVLNKRKGFIRLAIETGVPLVPCISFGEVDTFNQSTNKYLVKFANFVRKICGVSLIFFYGRGFFQYTFGFIQHRTDLNFVIGEPIEVQRNENPSADEIQQVHDKFKQSLTALFESHKKKFLKNSENVFLEMVA